MNLINEEELKIIEDSMIIQNLKTKQHCLKQKLQVI